MEVKLLANTLVTDEVWDRLRVDSPFFDDADQLAEYSGRLCYRSFDKPNSATAKNAGYLANILDHQHYSVLEHASASFLVEGVSRHLLGELTRHRHLSFSVESLRYCPPRGFAIHPTLAERERLTQLLENHWHTCFATYNAIYNDLREEGLAKKEAAEAAAQVLPLSTITDLVVSGNMRAWRDVIAKRNDPAANREIRQLAELILAELQNLAPNTFQDMA